ncbi:NAD(P)H-dependent oxidoreductase [Rhizobiaceae bacterium n13]|uniref:NAD(P)H-dependent oxidoreductase n=1 Tax=Ferirhizobium litorale TaxID=2927786 RepID=A0AAE3QGM3_9HYPH|nr:NAD(P)H-dependent oxidoreductase [Fererhizobium litorale]MDI7861955.1 NAD(P)H-dependent oxidoreductase [Fererhizobium litorale]MDI7922773.1 NAD(P)H-dependent oxidoreductase [Fererhizobium litorale]
MTEVAVFVGSLRKDSFSRKVAKALVRLTPSLSFNFLDIGKVSYFNQDLEDAPPADWVTLREAIARADAVLFVTAEYNRSVPGVLKNAIDVASRPYGKGALLNKPAGVVSTSIGAIGGFGANHHLRQSLSFLNMPVLAQPEAYIGNTGSLFDDAGELTNADTRKFLAEYGKAFTAHVKKCLDK